MRDNILSHSYFRISRRKFVRMGLMAAASSLVPRAIMAAVDESPPPQRELSFYNVFSKESIRVAYWIDGQYVPEALTEINHIFRDTRTGKIKPINTDLLDLLSSIKQELNSEEPFHIMSGYRTPKSNAILRKIRKGVAKNSLHMYGKAVDIRLPGHSIKDIKLAAMSLRQGGVGYYPRYRFVHVDVGEVRYWWG